MKHIKYITVLFLILMTWNTAGGDVLYCTYCGTLIDRNLDYCSNCTGDVKDIIINNQNSLRTIHKKKIKKESPLTFTKLSELEKQKIDFLVLKAEENYEKNRFQAAENFSKAAIRVYKFTKKAWFILARCELEKENYDRCRDYLVETLKIDPMFEDAIKLAKEVN